MSRGKRLQKRKGLRVGGRESHGKTRDKQEQVAKLKNQNASLKRKLSKAHGNIREMASRLSMVERYGKTLEAALKRHRRSMKRGERDFFDDFKWQDIALPALDWSFLTYEQYEELKG